MVHLTTQLPTTLASKYLINWFERPADEELRAVRSVLVPNPKPYTPGKIICNTCDGSGVCVECEGKAEIPHDCDCEHCVICFPCESCADDPGVCPDCEGEGEVVPNPERQWR